MDQSTCRRALNVVRPSREHSSVLWVMSHSRGLLSLPSDHQICHLQYYIPSIHAREMDSMGQQRKSLRSPFIQSSIADDSRICGTVSTALESQPEVHLHFQVSSRYPFRAEACACSSICGDSEGFLLGGTFVTHRIEAWIRIYHTSMAFSSSTCNTECRDSVRGVVLGGRGADTNLHKSRCQSTIIFARRRVGCQSGRYLHLALRKASGSCGSGAGDGKRPLC